MEKNSVVFTYPFKIYRFDNVDSCINIDYFVYDI